MKSNGSSLSEITHHFYNFEYNQPIDKFGFHWRGRRYKCEKVNGNIESQVIAKADLAHPQGSIKIDINKKYYG